MRVLGLDVGSVTVGVAISDPLGLFAQPIETLRRVGRKKDVEALVAIVQEREVGRIVVGLPLRTDGSEGDSAAEVRRMAEALEASLPKIPIVLQDERFTTAEAERSLIHARVRRKKRKAVIDQAAAVLILQSHLDSFA